MPSDMQCKSKYDLFDLHILMHSVKFYRNQDSNDYYLLQLLHIIYIFKCSLMQILPVNFITRST